MDSAFLVYIQCMIRGDKKEEVERDFWQQIATDRSEENAELIKELVEHVKQHAQENYDKGWDVVVEAMEDVEIADVLTDHVVPIPKTKKDAIKVMAEHVGAYNNHAREIKATAF